MKKTQLYPIHHQLSDKIIDFHGWQLPVQYSSIIEEHLAVRRGCGVFDISHMGLIKISGLDLIHFLDYLTPSNIRSISPGQCIYTLLLNEQGGIIDDVIINLHSAKDAVIVINASNRKKDMDWIKKKNESYSQGTKKQLLELKLISDNHSFLAVQGPRSFEILAKTLPDLALINNFSQTPPFRFLTFTYSDTPCTFSTTGYTGEKGGELIIHNNQVKEIFEQLIKNGATPCGLGARDSLRLEKGYSLYGNELDDKTNPFEAGLKWTIKMEKKDFIGKSALKYQLTSSVKKKIKGFTLIDRGIARHGYKVYNGDGKIIGIVTSGGYSPCTKKNIGLAMIDTDHQGDQIHIDIRNKKYRAKIRKRVMNY